MKNEISEIEKEKLKNKKCVVNLSISCYVKEILQSQSKDFGMNMSSFVTYLILEDLKKRKNF